MPTPVIAAPSAPYAIVRTNANAAGATVWYQRALIALWDAGLTTGVDPVVLAAQCGHETGFGRFGGAVTAGFGNTCGLKHRDATGDRPEDHARFALDAAGCPRVGALAHAHHLRLYCGLPVPADSPDPRAVWVEPGTSAFGSVDYVEQLGGKWAPAADYGKKVAALVARLKGA